MEKLVYKLEDFEGPLDLLLFLISKNKLDICKIMISELLEQYMEQINSMREEMDASSEFLEMAARLVHIKTLSLLPTHEEADELTAELSGQLIEYQLLKATAERMRPMISFDRMVRQPQEPEEDNTYRHAHTGDELLAAYLAVMGNKKRFEKPPVEAFTAIVSQSQTVSVTSRIVHVLRRLWKGEKVSYVSLFKEAETKSGMVATFLALLELIRGKRVVVGEDQKGLFVKICKAR